MSNVGKTILDILWEELDSIVDRIMDDGEPEQDHNGQAAFGVVQEWAEQRGQAQGVAYAIALLTDPLAPNVPTVREVAMQRWQERQDDPPPAPAPRSPRRGRVVVRRRHQQK